MRFQTRLFIIWGAVVLVLWAGTWWAVRHAIDTSFTRLAAENFDATRRDLHTLQAERIRGMRQAAAMVMNIPELRALIAEHNFEVSSENLASLQERLDNLAEIVGVNFVCVLDARGNVIAQNHGSPWKTLPELNRYLATSPPGSAMVKKVFQGEPVSKAVSANAFGMWSYQRQLYQVVGVPLVFNSDTDAAPAADGGLVMAAPLSDELAAGLAQSHKCQVSFLSDNSVAASSFAMRQRNALQATCGTWNTPAEHVFDATLDGISYRSSIEPITDPCSSTQVGAMLIQSDLKDATAARDSISRRLIVSMLGGLVAAGLASFFVSGAITRPVRDLCRGVQRLAQCDLDVKIHVRSRDELGELAAAFNDMVRHLRVRRELERVVEETRANSRAKSQFLANMSHEIRTPINGVIGMAELLLRSGLNDRQRRYAGMVKSSAEVLTTLINDILDFSKIEAGKLELESVEFDLRELTEDVVEMLALKATAKGLDVMCDILPDVPAMVRGDPTRLRQIIVNLVNNAIKFTDQGYVLVRVSVAPAPGEQPRILAEVIDTGIGIPTDRMDRLFQSFSQVDASTTRRFGGTGLGLAISKQLVELMGGTIDVISEPGRGSTFSFSIPLTAASEFLAPSPGTPGEGRGEDLQQSSGESPHSYPLPAYRERGQEAAQCKSDCSALAGVRVLVAERNEICRDILCRNIIELGNQAQGVSNAQAVSDALALAESQRAPYRIAIVDEQVVSIDALQLQTNLSILVLVASGTETELPGNSSSRLRGYVTKPVRRSQLIAALRQAVGDVTPPTGASSRNSTSEPSTSGTGQRQFRVLLAEDNPINQMVGAELLASAKYACDVVGDGEAAVAAFERGGYDLVLMDCQMPKLDGFGATAAIRSRELRAVTDGGRPARIPIIALTANAGDGDRESCLAAGMDCYCAKPFNVDQLLGIIRSLLPTDNLDVQSPMTASEPSPIATAAPSPAQMVPTPFDTDGLLRRCTGNAPLASAILDKFEVSSGEMMERLEQNLRDGEFEEIARASHRLKGTAGILSADALHAAATQLETLIHAGESASVADGMERLHREIIACIAYIAPARAKLEQVAITTDKETAGGV